LTTISYDSLTNSGARRVASTDSRSAIADPRVQGLGPRIVFGEPRIGKTDRIRDRDQRSGKIVLTEQQCPDPALDLPLEFSDPNRGSEQPNYAERRDDEVPVSGEVKEGDALFHL